MTDPSSIITTPDPNREARAALAARLAVEDRQAHALEIIAIATSILALEPSDAGTDTIAKRALRGFLETVTFNEIPK